MNSKNYTDVLIGGKIYTLGGLEEESYLQQVASHINEKLAELRRQNGFLKQGEDYQSVMVYLNLADDYFKEREHARVLSEQKEELEKEAYSLKHELVGTQMKLEALQQEMKSQKNRGKPAAEAENAGPKARAEADKTEERPADYLADRDAAEEEIRRLSEQVSAMKSELERYRAIEAARNSAKGQKGHR